MAERSIDRKLRRRVLTFTPGAAMLKKLAAEPGGLAKVERFMRVAVEACIIETAWYAEVPDSMRAAISTLPADEHDDLLDLTMKIEQDRIVQLFVTWALRRAGVIS